MRYLVLVVLVVAAGFLLFPIAMKAGAWIAVIFNKLMK